MIFVIFFLLIFVAMNVSIPTEITIHFCKKLFTNSQVTQLLSRSIFGSWLKIADVFRNKFFEIGKWSIKIDKEFKSKNVAHFGLLSKMTTLLQKLTF